MVELRVKKIYKLLDDYQEIFINKASQTIVRYEELQKSKRTIHKDHYNDIYILEPHKYYKVDSNFINVLDELKKKYNIIHGEGACEERQPHFQVNIDKKWINSGLITLFKEEYFYIYNSGENMVLIQDDALIGDVDFYG